MIEHGAASLADRYLSGKMSSEEEREFLRRHGSDPEIRARLDAEQRMRRGIAADRSVLPMPGTGSRARMIAMLDALPAEPGPVRQRPDESQQPAPEPSTPSIPARSASSHALHVAGLVAAAGLITMLTIMLDRPGEPEPAPQSARDTSAQSVPHTIDGQHDISAIADTISRTGKTTSKRGTKGPTSPAGDSAVIRDTITAIEPPGDGADTVRAARPHAAARQEKTAIPLTIEEPTINGKTP